MAEIRTVRPQPYLFLTVAFVLGDQLTKLMVGQPPTDIGSVSLGREINPSGIFGLGLANEVLIGITLAVCIALALVLATRPLSPPTRLGLWLLLGGALSNVLDRVLVGGVIDIIAIAGSPRFNLADVMIVLGATSLIRALWWRPREGSWS